MEEKLAELEKKVTRLYQIISGISTWPDPWINLKRACVMKGINYNSLSSNMYKWRRPRGGEPDAVLNGKDHWRPEAIKEWILMTDDDLYRRHKQKR